MHPFRWLVLAALISAFLYFCVATWRLYSGRAPAKPLREYTGMALLCVLMAWQDVTWLRAHPDASLVRYVGVWIELGSAAGIAVLMLLNARIAKTPTYLK